MNSACISKASPVAILPDLRTAPSVRKQEPPGRNHRHGAWQRGLVAWLVLAVTLFVPGCVVQFVSNYDEFTDRALYELHAETNAFIARVSANRSSYAANATFYAEAKGKVQAIRARSEQFAKNEEEVSRLNALENQFDRLAAKHRLGPLHPGLTGSIELTFRQLTRIQLAKKRSAGPSRTPQAAVQTSTPE